MGNYEKFSTAEIVLGSLLTLFADFFFAVLDVFIIGVIIGPILQGGVTFGMQIWFRSKGDPDAMNIGRQIVKYAANFLPLLPTTFIVFIWSTFTHNRKAPGE